MTDAINPVDPFDVGAASSGATATAENPGATLDRDAFLKLLVAQLKYQDPTKPADASQMVAQSAQLTMVDRLNEIANSLATANTGNQLVLAGTLVGKQIEFLDDTAATQSAVVDTVRIDGTTTVLRAGDWSVPLDAVTAVSDAVDVAAAAASTVYSTSTAATASTGSADATSGSVNSIASDAEPEAAAAGALDEDGDGLPDAEHASAVDDVAAPGNVA